MEKYIPKVVGSWLAGTFDQDRAVRRAAENGIGSFLDTEDKVLLFWKRCQVQILDYAQEAVNETPQTLSDERNMSADDVQAKYFRVIGSSISLLLNLLAKLSDDEIKKHQEKYDEVLADNKKLWALVASEDSFVRKAIDQLLIICLGKQPVMIENNLEILSHAFITSALRASQTNSAFQLIQALSALTQKFPQIWQYSGTGKHSASSRLRGFVEKGSQGGPPEFWQALRSFLAILPTGVLPSESHTSIEFLQAVRTGISRREEPRSNSTHAWSNYFAICKLIYENSSNVVGNEIIFRESVFPVFEQYLFPSMDNGRWYIDSVAALATGYMISMSIQATGMIDTFRTEWQRHADHFVSRLQTTLPEQSKEYQKSQDSVTSLGHRWFGLLGEISRTKGATDTVDFVGNPSTKILKSALSVMVNRNGKPYSSAATLEAAFQLSPKLFKDLNNLDLLKGAVEKYLPNLILTPSGHYLVPVLFHVQSLQLSEEFLDSTWKSTMEAVLASSSNVPVPGIVTALIASDSVKGLVQANNNLQGYLENLVSSLLSGESQEWATVETAIAFDSFSDLAKQTLLDKLIHGLEMDISVLNRALRILELISRTRPALLRSHDIHLTLITRLLALTELSDSDIVSRAQKLRAIIESSSDAPSTYEAPAIHIIRENLQRADSMSLQ